jgi:hypothetical protein
MNSKILELSEELWRVAEKLVPAPLFKEKGSLGGRPNLNRRQILAGVLYVLSTGW